MPIENYQSAVETIDAFLKMVVGKGGLRLKYRITAGAGAADPHKFESREIYVEIAGPDVDLVLEHNAELLRSLEHIAAKSAASGAFGARPDQLRRARIQSVARPGIAACRRYCRRASAAYQRTLPICANEFPRTPHAAPGLEKL